MTYNEVMKKLESLGTAQTKRIYQNHGNDLDMYGVSIQNLKKVLKPIKNDKELGLKLLFSKNADAIYLSQWIVDSSVLTIGDLESIIKETNYYMILEYALPQIVVKNKRLTWECLHKWIHHDNPRYRQTAYSLYSLVLGKYPNEEIKQRDVINQLNHIKETIHTEENRVKYTMNGFVISAGIYNEDITNLSLEIAQRIGKVQVYMGKTACKVPYAVDYIHKVKSMGKIGTKR